MNAAMHDALFTPHHPPHGPSPVTALLLLLQREVVGFERGSERLCLGLFLCLRQGAQLPVGAVRRAPKDADGHLDMRIYD